MTRFKSHSVIALLIGAWLLPSFSPAASYTQQLLRKVRANSVRLALNGENPRFSKEACGRIKAAESDLAAKPTAKKARKAKLIASLAKDRVLLDGNLKEANTAQKLALKDLIGEVDEFKGYLETGKDEEAKEMLFIYSEGLECP